MNASLVTGRLLRRAGAPEPVDGFRGVQIDDERLAAVLSRDATLIVLHEGILQAEGPIWSPEQGRLFWSDVPNRRLLQRTPNGEVKVAIDGTYFMNGNAGGWCTASTGAGASAAPIRGSDARTR